LNGVSGKIAPDGDGRWNDDDDPEKHDQNDHSPVDVAEALREIAHNRESLSLASGEIVNRRYEVDPRAISRA
jgi:hypothetical protein